MGSTGHIRLDMNTRIALTFPGYARSSDKRKWYPMQVNDILYVQFNFLPNCGVMGAVETVYDAVYCIPGCNACYCRQ